MFENVFLNRSLCYEKIVQIECKTANLFARFAKMQPILLKDSARRAKNIQTCLKIFFRAAACLMKR
nr:MAG TPA: hypothetical protein [Crassvirales sp.]